MQLAVFDSLDGAPRPAGGLLGGAHGRPRAAHDHPAGRRASLGVGAGAPPVVTDDGLLLLFHERDGARALQRRKAALLDHDDRPGEVAAGGADHVARSSSGSGSGDVNNVVFVQGAIPRADGTIYMTYGAADRAWAPRPSRPTSCSARCARA